MSASDAPLLSGFHWMVIPHGRVPEAALQDSSHPLRATVRIVPRITSDYVPAPPPADLRLRDLVRSRDPIGVDAIADWPRFVASLKSIEIAYAVPGAGRSDSPQSQQIGDVQTLDIAAAWRRSLERHGATPEIASGIWRHMFSPDLPLDAAQSNAAAQSVGVRLKQFTRLAPLPHGTGADLLRETIGQLHANSLAKSATAPVERPRPARFLTRTAAVVEARVEHNREDSLSGLTDIIGGIGQPVHAQAYRSRLLAGESAIQRAIWDNQLQRVAAVGFPFSSAGQDELDERIKVWQGRPNRLEGDDYELKHFVIDRLVANSPNLVRSPRLQGARARPAGAGNPTPRDPNDPEFHRDIGKLALHTWLLQVLALAIDFEIALPAPDHPSVSIFVKKLTWGTTDIIPDIETRVVTSESDDWHPSEDPESQVSGSPFNPLYRKGCVRVSAVVPKPAEPRFRLEQLDIDSATEKLVSVSQSLSTQFDAGATDRTTTLPTFRTGGLSFLMKKQKEQADLSAQRHERLAQDAQKNKWSDLHAEDLVIGYRPDVQPLAPDDHDGACWGAWKSLVGRQVSSFRVSGHEHARDFAHAPRDEGVVTHHARLIDDPQAESGMLLSFDEMFCWRGWNLAVPTVEALGRGSRNTRDRSTLSYYSAGALPRQRFGWGYRVGLRVVYADGKSVDLQEAALVYDDDMQDCALGTDSVGGVAPAKTGNPQAEYYAPFFRYEAIQPPQIRASSTRIDREGPTARADRLMVASDGLGHATVREAERLLSPPLLDLDATIRTGKFDAPGTKSRPPKALQLPDPWANRMVFGVYRRGDNQLLRLDYFDYYGSGKWPDSRDLRIRLEAAIEETLPADGVDFRWKTDDTFVIKLAPGAAVLIRCWHEIDASKLATSGLVEAMAAWLTSQGATGCRDILGLPDCANLWDMRDRLVECLGRWHEKFPYDLRPYMAAGRPARDITLTSFSMLNPATTLELVHAVAVPARAPRFCEGAHAFSESRRPLCEPDNAAHTFANRLPVEESDIREPFAVQRDKRGDTVAEFGGDIELHRASSARLDCTAQWEEVSDNTGSKPSRTKRQHQMFHVDVAAAVLLQPDLFDSGGMQLIGAGAAPELPLDNDLVLLRANRTCLGRTSNPDIDGTSKHFDFEDARARLLQFSLKATSRFVHDFPKTQSHVRDTDRPTSRWLMATLPPKKPEVAFIVPLFEILADTNGGTIRRRRRGGWFRIWLERPWFTSGDGELLALVCWPGNVFRPSGGSGTYLRDKARQVWGTFRDQAARPPSQLPPLELSGLYTGWGLDPIWQQDNTPLYFIPPGAFTNRLLPDVPGVIPSQFQDGSVADPSGLAVGLALYKPQYDETERRWFADIRIAPNDDAYFPFVRLGLARYQPNAIAGCELSEIVSTEFVQLIPERSCTITVVSAAGRDHDELRVRINGPHSTGPADPERQNAVSRIVLRVDRATDRARDEAARTWVPCRDISGAEEISLDYDPGQRLWKSSPRYQFDRNSAYSAYIEEREAILVDNPGDARQGAAPSATHRLIYADRILLRSP
jgi:hypothetical protein